MCTHNGLRLPNLCGRKTSMVSQRYLRSQPKLGLAIWMRNMHVNARLFPREKEKTKLTVSNNGGCHVITLTNFHSTTQQP